MSQKFISLLETHTCKKKYIPTKQNDAINFTVIQSV